MSFLFEQKSFFCFIIKSFRTPIRNKYLSILENEGRFTGNIRRKCHGVLVRIGRECTGDLWRADRGHLWCELELDGKQMRVAVEQALGEQLAVVRIGIVAEAPAHTVRTRREGKVRDCWNQDVYFRLFLIMKKTRFLLRRLRLRLRTLIDLTFGL